MNTSFRPWLSALLVLLAALFTGCNPCNKVQLKSGSLDFLKQQSVVNVVYDYDGLRVGMPKKSISEAEHIAKKTAARNAKTSGAGDLWSNEWVSNRTIRYQPKFEALLNKQVGKTVFGQHPEAPFTLVLKTTYLEPGWHAGIMAQPALLNAEAKFVETQKPANTLALISLGNMVGMDPMGNAFDEGWRIQESYAMAGKRMGIIIHKKIK